MTQQETNPYWILDAARKFKMSADLLAQTSLQFLCSEIPEENSLSTSTSVSSIVLYALSIELGLKSLIGLEKAKPKKEHDLKKLFYLLSENLRNRIINQLPETRFKTHIDRFLEENKKNFENWRYYYEKTTVADSDFLKALSEAIINVGESYE